MELVSFPYFFCRLLSRSPCPKNVPCGTRAHQAQRPKRSTWFVASPPLTTKRTRSLAVLCIMPRPPPHPLPNQGARSLSRLSSSNPFADERKDVPNSAFSSSKLVTEVCHIRSRSQKRPANVAHDSLPPPSLRYDCCCSRHSNRRVGRVRVVLWNRV